MAAIEDIQRSFSESLDQLQALANTLEGEVERIRKEARRRRDALAARAESEAAKLREGVTRELSDAFETASNLGRDATRRVGEQLSGALSGLDIATGSDLKKLDRKLNRISKRVRELERRPTA